MMSRNKELLRAIQAVCALMCVCSSPAFAQNNDDSKADNNNAALEEVFVTGSRIKRTDLSSPSPLQVMDSEFISDVGATLLDEALMQNPALRTPGSSRFRSTGSITNAGMSTANLRLLGDNRTLTLIDGRRSVGGQPANATVDLNMVPTGFIDRVEVLTGGASAVYGSDALAGVVNLIYRKDFEGMEFNIQTGKSILGDDETSKATLLTGANFADGRGNFMTYVSYSDQGLAPATNRDRTDDGYRSLGVAERSDARTAAIAAGSNDLIYANIANLHTPLISNSGVHEGGTFQIYPDETTNPDYPNRWTRDLVTGEFRPLDSVNDVFSSAPYRSLASPLTRKMFATRVSFDVTESTHVFMETTYANTQSMATWEASPVLSAHGSIGIYRGGSGRMPIEHWVPDPATGTIQGTTPVRNPLVPDELYDFATDSDGDGLKDMSWSKRTTDWRGPRNAPIERNLYRFVMGVNGEISDNWSYDVYYQYGNTNQNTRMGGLLNHFNMQKALNGVTDIYDVDGDGDTTDAVCLSAEARAQGCIPIDIFANGALPEQVHEFVQGEVYRQGSQTLSVFSANIQGDAFEMPAGPLKVAAGIEQRSESAFNKFDPLSNQAANGYTQQRDIGGSMDVNEVYIETIVPVVDALSLTGAFRSTDYSTIDRFSASNLGFEWDITDYLRVRAVHALAVRAPNIGELYAPRSAGVGSISDPCEGVTTSDTSDTAVNCRADPDIAANIAANGGVMTLAQSDRQGVGTVSEAGTGVTEESGTTNTIGVIFNLDNISVTIDAFEVEVEDLITRDNTDTILRECYENGNERYCAMINRRSVASPPYSVGAVEQISRQLVNSSGGAYAKGADLTASYGTGLWGGEAVFSLSWTHLVDQYTIDTAGQKNEQAGEIENPKNKMLLKASFDKGKWNGSVSGQYIGVSYLDDNRRDDWQLIDGSEPDKSHFKVDAEFYFDTQISYAFSDHYEVYMGGRNIFDNKGPRSFWDIGTDRGTWDGVYDSIGARWYAGARVSF